MAELRAPMSAAYRILCLSCTHVMRNNYGKWVFHSHPKPGVLYHRAENGAEVWTVKFGTARQMDGYTIR